MCDKTHGSYSLGQVYLKKRKEKKRYECGNVVIVLARKRCNIQFPDGSSLFFFFFKFWNDFSFSSQVLRSLNAFWSWGWPGNLRTYTNAPKIQTTGFYFSLFLTQIPQTVFFLFGFWFAFRSTQTLILVSFSLPPFVLLLFIAHVMSWSPLSFNSRSFGAGISFIQNYRSFCQNLSVYFINKCL